MSVTLKHIKESISLIFTKPNRNLFYTKIINCLKDVKHFK